MHWKWIELHTSIVLSQMNSHEYHLLENNSPVVSKYLIFRYDVISCHSNESFLC